ncbi:hypothetical protein AVEN_71615-1 [Araneus ventricosus]|uniref:Uncharacterized protein n=1 Tax=Araneus ventricosus TaxID=182803 RepID=A0A4Y2GCF8_ARAVE|nr:hypothetical protein AVEN_71615-1 [Araneus ventricosus]
MCAGEEGGMELLLAAPKAESTFGLGGRRYVRLPELNFRNLVTLPTRVDLKYNLSTDMANLWWVLGYEKVISIYEGENLQPSRQPFMKERIFNQVATRSSLE